VAAGFLEGEGCFAVVAVALIVAVREAGIVKLCRGKTLFSQPYGIHRDPTDEEGKTFYIYVCTYGNLATGKYWPTHRNDLLPRGEYDWGADGRYYPAQ
jgi:hypothetical protein